MLHNAICWEYLNKKFSIIKQIFNIFVIDSTKKASFDALYNVNPTC